jgi:predicted O-methyltransferase YrrM
MLEDRELGSSQQEQIAREQGELSLLPKAQLDLAPLRQTAQAELATIFSCASIAQEWPEVAGAIDDIVVIEDMKTGGVNPGDRRALYYLTRALRARRVLEIGTHVGASTIHIAAAMKRNAENASDECRLVTVDISDVNDADDAYWKRAGLACSPRDAIAAIGVAPGASFIMMDSISYLDAHDGRFDLIFLDGDHAAQNVYLEIPRALQHLCPGGVVVMHDVFPGLRPLWRDGALVPGPFLAVQRFRSERAEIKLLPLGALPWPTKLGSHVTSLALLSRTWSG